jgi:flagellar basal body-associated protein FliL
LLLVSHYYEYVTATQLNLRCLDDDDIIIIIIIVVVVVVVVVVVIIIIIISCHRFSFFPGTSALEPVVNPTTQALSLSL